MTTCSQAGDGSGRYVAHPHPSTARRNAAPYVWEWSIPDRSPGHAFLPMAVTQLISPSLNSGAVAILVAQTVKR